MGRSIVVESGLNVAFRFDKEWCGDAQGTGCCVNPLDAQIGHLYMWVPQSQRETVVALERAARRAGDEVRRKITVECGYVS